MNYVKKFNNQKATVCADKTCVTVYGKAGEFVSAIIAATVLLLCITLLAKAIK